MQFQKKSTPPRLVEEFWGEVERGFFAKTVLT
jgi:hypothetical protein